MSTRNTLGDACHCTDEAVDRLRALIAAGLDQWTASRAVWGPRVTVSERLKARLLRESGRVDYSLPVALACLLGVVAVVVGGLR